MLTKHFLYNNTIELCFDDSKHLYTVDGQKIDGVTSILGIINKPALMYWAVNQACEYLEKNLPCGVVLDELQKKSLIDGAKGAHRKKSGDAADHGTILHEWIEKHVKGFAPELPTNPILKKSAEQFLEWIKQNNVVFQASEQKVYSKKYNYCGTLDFIATINGKLVLGDIKTSSGFYDEMDFQLAAYKYAYQEEFPEVKIDHTAIIRCGKDGVFEVKEINDFEANFNAFFGAMALHRRLNQMKFNNK